MACSCINEMDARLAEHNTRLVRTFTIRPEMAEFPKLATEKINTRNRRHVVAVPTYCPFCGVPYENQPAVPAQAES